MQLLPNSMLCNFGTGLLRKQETTNWRLRSSELRLNDTLLWFTYKNIELPLVLSFFVRQAWDQWTAEH